MCWGCMINIVRNRISKRKKCRIMLMFRRYTMVMFVLLIVIWGSGIPIIKIGLEYCPPILFSGLRMFLGGLLMAVVAALWGGAISFSRTWHIIGISAMFNVVLFTGLMTFSIDYLPSGLAAVLIYMQPILVGIIARIWLGEALSPKKITGLLLGFIGVVMISVFKEVSEASSLTGIVLGITAAFVWAVGTVYVKSVQEKVSILWLVAGQFIVGGLVLLLVGLWAESWFAIAWTLPFWFSLLFTAIIGVAFAWVLWFVLIHEGQASSVSSYTFAVPLISILLGTILLNEKVTLSLFIGSVLIGLGIYLVNRQAAESSEISGNMREL